MAQDILIKITVWSCNQEGQQNPMDLQESSDSSKMPCGTDQISVHVSFGSPKNSNGREIQRQKERMAESIPFKCGNKTPKNLSQITIKWIDADGKENKEECPIFKNGTQNKGLIQTIERIFVLGNRYNWKDGKEKLYYQNFERVLKGEPRKKWEGLIKSVRNKIYLTTSRAKSSN